MRKLSKCQKHAVQHVEENVQQHTVPIFWKIFVPVQISNSFEVLLQQVVNGEFVLPELSVTKAEDIWCLRVRLLSLQRGPLTHDWMVFADF